MKGSIGLLLLIILLILVSGCTSEELTQQELNDEALEEIEEQPPTLVDESDKENQEIADEEVFLDFNLDGEKIEISLNNVNILHNYLNAAKDREQAINDMTLLPIKLPDRSSLYLLEFSCNQDQCSYILLDQTDQGKSYLLADLTKLDTVTSSLTQDKLLFVFQREEQVEENTFDKHKLLIVDLLEWKTLPISVSISPSFDNYEWPVLSTMWKDNETIMASIPDVDEPTISNLTMWKEMEQPLRTTTIKIEN